MNQDGCKWGPEDATAAFTPFYDYAVNGDDWGTLEYADGTVNECGSEYN